MFTTSFPSVSYKKPTTVIEGRAVEMVKRKKRANTAIKIISYAQIQLLRDHKIGGPHLVQTSPIKIISFKKFIY